MNMNDKEWNEFWDNEPDEDDDDYTDYGDDIDANNDETFANASEWNEDEHEEMIARDSILSHTIRSNNNRTSHSNRATAISNSRVIGNNNNNNINSNNNNNNIDSAPNNLSQNHGGDASSRAYVSNIIGSAGRAGWNSLSDKDLFPNLPLPRQENRQPQTSSNTAWQNTPTASERLQMLQLQQQQLLLQRQQQEQQQQLREQPILQHQNEQLLMHQQNQNPLRAPIDGGRQVLTVDELERQLVRTRIDPHQQSNLPSLNLQPELLRRSGWSPFGGKDLFTSTDSSIHNQIGLKGQIPDLLSQTLSLEQQQQILLHQHNLLQQQQLQHMQQMALLKQQQIQQEQRFMSQNPQCFTVEELERQMIAGRSNDQKVKPELIKAINPQISPKSARINERQENREGTNNRKDNFKYQRSDRHENDLRNGSEHRNRREFNDRKESRDHRVTARDSHRDGREYRHHNRKRLVIVPPQVQLSVIDKAKSLKLTDGIAPEDLLQDRMQMSRDGLIFKSASNVNSHKSDHDGVLTDKERDWLKRIQEKIQADYDDNLDQDYYYLLYFNRSSMTDEAAQKPGPGVLDRRFIPRERLLYNAST